MSNSLIFVEGTLQEIALIFMGTVYILRLIWLFRFKAGRDRQAPTGLPGTTPKKGIIYSWANIAMPWAMESTRKKFFLYIQFVIFHVGGVTVAIGMSFIIPYADHLLESIAVVRIIQVLIGAAFAVGCIRIIRRIFLVELRAISTPDDYFSLILLTTWFLSAVFAAPNQPALGEAALIIYFILTAFFLVYVPFSKISHYLYYPITRYYFGKTMGYRGIYPMRSKN